MNLVVTVLLRDGSPRTSSFSFHVDIFDTFRGHGGGVVLVHILPPKKSAWPWRRCSKGLLPPMTIHELPFRHILGKGRARMVRTYPSAAGAGSLGVMRRCGGHLSYGSIAEIDTPPVHGFQRLQARCSSSSHHAVTCFEVYHHFGYDGGKTRVLSGDVTVMREVGACSRYPDILHLWSACTENETIFLDNGYNPLNLFLIRAYPG